ncbi:hypothetical protein ANCCAN_05612 [Ancylostoma caninum]|uniref:Uncharacterized protein n=1 Tax=Ancylostoma caninum TaxID=29170 RepID=A0A368GVC6_ANCCA|nr:hypothetical protein ANCCAN_05612 [Ancylostoma caninum]
MNGKRSLKMRWIQRFQFKKRIGRHISHLVDQNWHIGHIHMHPLQFSKKIYLNSNKQYITASSTGF